MAPLERESLATALGGCGVQMERFGHFAVRSLFCRVERFVLPNKVHDSPVHD